MEVIVSAPHAQTGVVRLALVDTGADECVVFSGLADELNLPLIREGEVFTAEGRVRSIYVEMDIRFCAMPVVINAQASKSPSTEFFEAFPVVLGRSVLDKGTLILSEGRTGSFALDLTQLSERGP